MVKIVIKYVQIFNYVVVKISTIDVSINRYNYALHRLKCISHFKAAKSEKISQQHCFIFIFFKENLAEISTYYFVCTHGRHSKA